MRTLKFDSLRRQWLAVLFCFAMVGSPALRAADQPEKGSDLAAADQLKSKAFEALRAGKFSQTSQFLDQAAEISKDPTVARMAEWTRQFEQQRQGFASERRKEHDLAVAEVKLLQENGKETYAVDAAARAYLLADDKTAFRSEKWMDELVTNATKLADQFETQEQWVKLLRLYTDLTTIEPAKPEWKDKLKLVTRRIRLLALYSPDSIKQIRDSESKEREQVDGLIATLKPTTHPAKPAATQPAEENEDFKTDWHDTLKGVQMDMLRGAIDDAVENYWRDVNYRVLAVGGLKGLRAVATTRGLDKAFPQLADEAKRNDFIKAIDARLEKVQDGRRQMGDLLDEVTELNEKTLQLPESVLANEFADGAFGELDPFSNVIWPTELEEFQKSTRGEFSGVGIQIESDEDGNLKVVSPLEDSPAYNAHIKPGDIISHINGKSAKNITTTQAVKQITGPQGTPVTLTILSTDGQSRDVVLRRQTIKVASVKGWSREPGGAWDYFVDPDQKIAYIRLTNFSQTSSDDLAKAIASLKDSGLRGIILDLRYNPGGLLSAATDICDKFIPQGVLVSTRPDRDTPNQRQQIDAQPNKTKIDVPLVVLINQYSASASEIVSGALKDHKRALLVGERTFGKGSVQMLFPLEGRRAVLKLTTSHYYLPSGQCIHREENSTKWGVDPDVTIEMTPEQMRAAIDARQQSDILRDAGEGSAPQTQPTTKAAKNPLAIDPQLAAALLMMRLELAGAKL